MAPGSDGINGVRLANAIHLSSWNGQEVSLDFDEDEYLAELNNRIREEGKFPERNYRHQIGLFARTGCVGGRPWCRENWWSGGGVCWVGWVVWGGCSGRHWWCVSRLIPQRLCC